MNSVFSRHSKVVAALLAGIACATAAAAPAAATPYLVDALANSSTGGVALPTISLTNGQNFSTSVATTDLWNAGALPRWSNANGLNADLYATGSDEFGQLAGTHIGQDFGLWNQFSFSAPYGSLVGEINGTYQLLGTAFSGPAWDTGVLNLFYWELVNGDNSEHVTVNISVPNNQTAVPEPSSLLLLGLGLFAFVAVRRKSATSAASVA